MAAVSTWGSITKWGPWEMITKWGPNTKCEMGAEHPWEAAACGKYMRDDHMRDDQMKAEHLCILRCMETKEAQPKRREADGPRKEAPDGPRR